MASPVEALTLGELMERAKNRGAEFAADEKERGCTGAAFLVETVAHGAKFETGIAVLPEALRGPARTCAAQLARWVVSGTIDNDAMKRALERAVEGGCAVDISKATGSRS